ncbi:hypothetical protein GmHk_18G052707 [Glycine max]|nr:hypothetical protein GmHk_18G052707 [Glycine max]
MYQSESSCHELASLPTPVHENVGTLAYFSLHPGGDAAALGLLTLHSSHTAHSTKFNVGCRKPNTTLSFYPGLGPAKNSKANLGRRNKALIRELTTPPIASSSVAVLNIPKS